MFREGKLISDLCQRETFTLGIWGKIAHKSQVLDQKVDIWSWTKNICFHQVRGQAGFLPGYAG